MLGHDNPLTLATRNNMANLTKETGDIGEALRLLREVLADKEWVLGADQPSTLTAPASRSPAWWSESRVGRRREWQPATSHQLKSRS